MLKKATEENIVVGLTNVWRLLVR